jgi:hypothetical protein
VSVEWLLASAEPGICLQARRDLLGEDVTLGDEVLGGPLVRGLLVGGDDEHPYRKWTGAHWRLVSLVELGIPAGEPRAVRMAERVLDWLGAIDPPVVDGLTRAHASMQGNALAVCARLGLAGDSRVAALAEALMRWQWPDGGWNCDRRATGRRSSFHESLTPAWGLLEYWRATGSSRAREAALRTAELLLSHRLFRSAAGEPINRAWLTLHHPPYWHYDILHALLVLSRMGLAGDERCADALDVLERRRLPDGRWRPGSYYWNPPGSERSEEAVDWGRSAPSEPITLNALRVLRAAGRAG